MYKNGFGLLTTSNCSQLSAGCQPRIAYSNATTFGFLPTSNCPQLIVLAHQNISILIYNKRSRRVQTHSASFICYSNMLYKFDAIFKIIGMHLPVGSSSVYGII